MHNISWMYAGLLVVALTGEAGFSATSVQAQPPAPTLVQRIVDFFRSDAQDRRRGVISGSRPVDGGEALCLISPGDSETLWHQQPLVLLQGDVPEIGVQALGDSRAIPWTTAPTQTESGLLKASYSGTPLTPGMPYGLLIYQEQPGQTQALTLRIPFRIMPEGEERDRITAELNQLTTNLATNGADAEAIAQSQADYFLANNLPADALQALFAVSSPSEALATARDALVADICSEALVP